MNLRELKKEIDEAISNLDTKESLIGFLKNLRSDVADEIHRIKEPYELFGIECSYGWYGLILPIYMRIQEYNEGKPEEEQISIDQIKEKFGGLRFYISNAPQEFYDMVDRAESESYKICEFCGSTEGVSTKGKGWITTKCKHCRGDE